MSGGPRSRSMAFRRELPRTPRPCSSPPRATRHSYSITLPMLPSWVRAPSYKLSSASSLVVAFEDPDGGRLSSLMAARHLYIFGVQATVKRWKQKPPPKRQETTKKTAGVRTSAAPKPVFGPPPPPAASSAAFLPRSPLLLQRHRAPSVPTWPTLSPPRWGLT